jgi:hypothetical protein
LLQVAPEGTTLYFNAFGVHAELFVSGTSAWYDYLGAGGSMHASDRRKHDTTPYGH